MATWWRWLLLMWATLPVALGAEPPALAVLPLTQAAGSDSYAGLGDALAGMLVSDLAQVPAIRLVERARIDALLAETRLGDSGYVDPATAQKMGRGIGASLVLVGSYSVVDQQFLMDARVVRVESGAVIDAAHAAGTVADFVAVEKEVVEGLLSRLEVALSTAERRKLLMQAPTEQFDALAAYGAGLAARKQGDAEAARQAFERALQVDPEFADAQAALASLRGSYEREKAATQAKAAGAQQAVWERILAEVPSDRDRPAGFVYDIETLPPYVLRLVVLENMGRDCEHYAELRHYLERVGWQVSEPPAKPNDGVFSYRVRRLADDYGLAALPHDAQVPKLAKEDPTARTYLAWRTPFTLIMGDDALKPHETSSGLVPSLRRCFTPAEQLRELDAVRAAVTKAGQAGARRSAAQPGDLTLGEALELTWAWVRATELGASPELQRRLDALLAARPDGDPVRRTLLARVDQLVRQAEAWEDDRARRFGRGDAEIEAFMTALAAGKGASSAGWCSFPHRTESGNAQAWVDRMRDPKNRTFDSNWHAAALVWATFRDLGCIEGVPGRFGTVDDVIGAVESARAHAIPERLAACAHALSGAEAAARNPWAKNAPDPTQQSAAAWMIALQWNSLVAQRCIAP